MQPAIATSWRRCCSRSPSRGGTSRGSGPFRESHDIVGRLVLEAERAGVPLDRVPPAVAAAIHPALGAALAQLGTWEDSIEGRATPGGSARQSVEQQIEELRKAFTLGGAG